MFMGCYTGSNGGISYPQMTWQVFKKTHTHNLTWTCPYLALRESRIDWRKDLRCYWKKTHRKNTCNLFGSPLFCQGLLREFHRLSPFLAFGSAKMKELQNPSTKKAEAVFQLLPSVFWWKTTYQRWKTHNFTHLPSTVLC